MAVSWVVNRLVIILAVAAGIAVSFTEAQGVAPAPAPASDGTSIDQGIAYVLMFLALVLTYLIHTMEGSSSYY